MTAAAFQAAYSDFKLIKTRGVVSISFEVPVAQAQQALDVLGGMPVAASEIWCGIARMATDAKEVVQPVKQEPTPTETPPRQQETQPVDGAKTGICVNMIVDKCTEPFSWDDGVPYCDTCGIFRNKVAHDDHQARTKTRTAFRDMRPANQAGILCDTPAFRKFMGERQNTTVNDSEHAAELVRWYCGVKSRSDIRPRTPSGDRWRKLFDEYQLWMHAPELVA